MIPKYLNITSVRDNEYEVEFFDVVCGEAAHNIKKFLFSRIHVNIIILGNTVQGENLDG